MTVVFQIGMDAEAGQCREVSRIRISSLVMDVYLSVLCIAAGWACHVDANLLAAATRSLVVLVAFYVTHL